VIREDLVASTRAICGYGFLKAQSFGSSDCASRRGGRKIRRLKMDSRRISSLLHGPVRCPYCGNPAHTVAIDLDSKQAEVYCQKCGTFEISARKLKLFRR